VGWRHPAEKLAAGTPLDNASHAAINVLTPPEDAPTALSTTPAASASISVLAPASAAPVAPAADPLARVGILITLLQGAAHHGGPQALALAAAAADATDDPTLKQALLAYKESIPAEGPPPLPLLVNQAAAVAALPPPSPAALSAPATNTPWWRRWLSRVVTLKPHAAPAPDRVRTDALAMVQTQLAADAPDAALATLTQPPLGADSRLDPLRALTAAYARDEALFAAVVRAYLALATPEAAP
jgi:hypothetical protein